MWIIDDTSIKAQQLSVLWQWMGYTAACRWGKLYYTPDDGFADRLKRHELSHQSQQLSQHEKRRIAYVIFCLKYAREWSKLVFKKGKKPYRDNPFEKEARFWQNTYQGWKNIKKDSWKQYI